MLKECQMEEGGEDEGVEFAIAVYSKGIFRSWIIVYGLDIAATVNDK